MSEILKILDNFEFNRAKICQGTFLPETAYFVLCDGLAICNGLSEFGIIDVIYCR